jgi:hypothetical protein
MSGDDKVKESNFRKAGTEIGKVIGNPFITFSISIAIAIVTIIFNDRMYQFFGIVGLGITYVIISISYFLYNEKISSVDALKRCDALQYKIKTLEDKNTLLEKTKERLESQSPNLITYKLVRKKILLLNDNGDADFTMVNIGINLSDDAIRTLRYFIDTEKEIGLVNIKEVVFNQETQKIFDLQKVKIVDTGTGKEQWHNILCLRPTNFSKPRQQLDTSYKFLFKDEYANAFKPNQTDFSSHTVNCLTDEVKFEIIAPTGYIFNDLDFNVRDPVNGIDALSEKFRVSRICPPEFISDRHCLIWVITKPILSYKYVLSFSLNKE